MLMSYNLKRKIMAATIIIIEDRQEFKINLLQEIKKLIQTTEPTICVCVCVCKNYEIKISEIQIALADYNIPTKQLKIDMYLPDYNELQQFEDLESNIDWIVMQIIGEIAFRKHIRQILLHPMTLEPIGL